MPVTNRISRLAVKASPCAVAGSYGYTTRSATQMGIQSAVRRKICAQVNTKPAKAASPSVRQAMVR